MECYSTNSLSEAQWQNYFEWHQRITRRYMAREWDGSWEHFRLRKIFGIGTLPFQEYLWESQGMPIAWLKMELESGRAVFDWNVDPELQPVPIQLLREICDRLGDFLEETKQEHISIETGNPAMPTLAELTNAELINRRYFYEFHKAKANLGSIRHEVKQFEARYPALSFSIIKNRPDAFLDEYIHLYNLVSADIPRADAQAEPYRSWPAEDLRKLNQTNARTGNLVYTGVLRDKDGTLAGLTDLNLNKRHPIRFYQGMTGVHPAHRSNGFGSWLKLAMLSRVWQDFPDFEIIDTDCNVLNLPVQRMNEGLGFVRTGEGWEYRIERGGLEAGRSKNREQETRNK